MPAAAAEISVAGENGQLAFTPGIPALQFPAASQFTLRYLNLAYNLSAVQTNGTHLTFDLTLIGSDVGPDQMTFTNTENDLVGDDLLPIADFTVGVTEI